MKSFLAFALMLLPFSALLQDAGAPRGSVDQIKQDLIAIEQEIGRANFTCDYKYFDRVEAEEFIFTDSSGAVTTKQEDLAGEKDCHKSDYSYVLDDTRVMLFGGTAVVNARVTISGNDRQGKPFTRQSRFTDVFVWRSGRWQLVAGHSSRIPEPKPKSS